MLGRAKFSRSKCKVAIGVAQLHQLRALLRSFVSMLYLIDASIFSLFQSLSGRAAVIFSCEALLSSCRHKILDNADANSDRNSATQPRAVSCERRISSAAVDSTVAAKAGGNAGKSTADKYAAGGEFTAHPVGVQATESHIEACRGTRVILPTRQMQLAYRDAYL